MTLKEFIKIMDEAMLIDVENDLNLYIICNNIKKPWTLLLVSETGPISLMLQQGSIINHDVEDCHVKRLSYYLDNILRVNPPKVIYNEKRKSYICFKENAKLIIADEFGFTYEILDIRMLNNNIYVIC